MDSKSAVLHWLQDVEASALNTALSDSDGGSLNPNTTRSPSVPQLGGLPYSLHYHDTHHHDNSLHPSQTLPTSRHGVRSPSLVPSSSFQVPEDPGKNEPPEVIRKLLRSKTLTGNSLCYQPNQTNVNPTNIGPSSKDDAGIKLAATCRGSHENLAFPKERPVYPPHRMQHQKHHSWSQIPIPASNPELVQPTIDLTNADFSSPKRKMLVQSSLSVSTTIKLSSFEGDPISPAPTKTLTRLTAVSPPNSAPVSPNRENPSTKLNEVKYLSHSNLASFESDKQVSDTSPNVSSRGSVDGQSHLADKGEFSDAATSDESQSMHCNSSTSSSLEQEIGNIEWDKAETISSQMLMNNPELEQPSKPGTEFFEDLHQGGNPQKSSSMLDLGSFIESEAALDNREKDVTGDKPSSREEELLGILKKWYNKGYGEKEDLIRALEITGHRKSAHELMKEDDGQRQKEDNLPVFDADVIVEDATVSKNPNQLQDSSPDSPSPHLPVQTTPPLTGHPTAPINRHISPGPMPSQSPEPVNLLPLSRKKLAELDKANCFTFDDSSDDILDAKSSNMVAKKSPLSSKTHSWSISDYSGSLTSSSSYSSHAISPSGRTGSPTFSKLSENSDRKKLNSTSPRRHGHSMFPIPMETKETPSSDRHLQSAGRPANAITSARRLKLLALNKSSSLVRDKYSSPLTENKSNVHKDSLRN